LPLRVRSFQAYKILTLRQFIEGERELGAGRFQRSSFLEAGRLMMAAKDWPWVTRFDVR
jgi:hypothetical protein